MEVRQLQEFEMDQVQNMTRGIWDENVTQELPEQDEKEFMKYTNQEFLKSETKRQELYLWGVFEDNVLQAVSAMDKKGAVKLFFVNPKQMGNGLEKMLMASMTEFQKNYWPNIRIQVDKAYREVANGLRPLPMFEGMSPLYQTFARKMRVKKFTLEMLVLVIALGAIGVEFAKTSKTGYEKFIQPYMERQMQNANLTADKGNTDEVVPSEEKNTDNSTGTDYKYDECDACRDYAMDALENLFDTVEFVNTLPDYQILSNETNYTTLSDARGVDCFRNEDEIYYQTGMTAYHLTEKVECVVANREDLQLYLEVHYPQIKYANGNIRKEDQVNRMLADEAYNHVSYLFSDVKNGFLHTNQLECRVFYEATYMSDDLLNVVFQDQSCRYKDSSFTCTGYDSFFVPSNADTPFFDYDCLVADANTDGYRQVAELVNEINTTTYVFGEDKIKEFIDGNQAGIALDHGGISFFKSYSFVFDHEYEDSASVWKPVHVSKDIIEKISAEEPFSYIDALDIP